MIYLDHNATTPVLPEVFEAMRPYFCEGGAIRPAHTNPAPTHLRGNRESWLHLGLGSCLVLPARGEGPIRTGQALAQTALSAYSWKER